MEKGYLDLINQVGFINNENGFILNDVELQKTLFDKGIDPNGVVNIIATPNGMKNNINYDSIIVILWEKCKELNLRIEELEQILKGDQSNA